MKEKLEQGEWLVFTYLKCLIAKYYSLISILGKL